ncbi:MAG: hypothetical protein KatS3mg116_0133 [Elioraea sp.]|nr:MAG: hypothetical protein KatS3mg116_0133 [Elioraea sp.]
MKGAPAPFFRATVENGSQMSAEAATFHPDRSTAATAVPDLDRAAQLALFALRGAAARGGTDAPLCLAFARAGISLRALAVFTELIALLDAGTRGTIALHAPPQAALSRDEALLLTGLAALQAGEPWVAQRALAEWLAPCLAPRGIALMACAAAELCRAGLRLQRRPATVGPPRLAS